MPHGCVCICHDSHRQRNRNATGGSEALVLADLISQPVVSNQPQRNCNDAGSEDARRDPPQYLCHGNRKKGGQGVEDQGAEGHSPDADCDQHAFRSDDIEKLAAGRLANQAGDATYSKDNSDVPRRPTVCRQVGCRDRSKGSLQAGHKEVEPAQGTQAPSRRCRGRQPSDVHVSTIIPLEAQRLSMGLGAGFRACESARISLVPSVRTAISLSVQPASRLNARF